MDTLIRDLGAEEFTIPTIFNLEPYFSEGKQQRRAARGAATA